MRISIALILVLFFISCEKPEPVLEEEVVEINSFDFESLVKGQKFEYVLMHGENYLWEGNNTFRYTDDTLIVKVVDVVDNLITTEQWITEGSEMFNSSEDYYWNKSMITTDW